MHRRDLIKGLGLAPLTLHAAHPPNAAMPSARVAPDWRADTATHYASKWHLYRDMPWTGEDLWAQRLQDFRIRDGQLECLCDGPDRTVHVLTHQVTDGGAPLQVRLGLKTLARQTALPADAVIGLRLGIRGRLPDCRSAIMTGKGLDAGVDGEGRLRLGDARSQAAVPAARLAAGVVLHLRVRPQGTQTRAELEAVAADGTRLARVEAKHPREDWTGSLALLSHVPGRTPETPQPTIAFTGLDIEGAGLSHRPEQAYGAVYFTQYTVHAGTLKLSAQLAPVDAPGVEAELQFRKDDAWHTVARAAVHSLARVAAFRVADWDAATARDFRVRYAWPLRTGDLHESSYEGTIAAEPRSKDVVRALTFSCNWDVGFPDSEVVEHASKHHADLAMFLGDQLYEPNGGFGIQMTPLPQAVLDYLRKWIQFGWSYRELFRRIPSLCLPDDHDMFHGNVWGSGGRATIAQGGAAARQDSGGYKMPAQWVNMAQLTQTSHMPDPFDPRPVQQGIGVYYTHWEYAGLSLGIIEDRKFKSAPRDILPDEAEVFNGYAHNPGYDRSKAKWHEAQLLGERQLEFLSKWNHEWSRDTRFKVLVSATAFGCLQTLPRGTRDDQGTPDLPIPAVGEYVQGDAPTQDMDSNGWPQNRRDDVLRLLRKNFTVHLTGDQHLPAVVQYGVDDYRDGGFNFACPPLCNLWPRRWWPPVDESHEPIPGQPRYTGDFKDGFGNRLTVYAAANPRRTGLEPARIYDRAPGYGVVDFNLREETVTMHCWPRQVDPAKQPDGQYTGWPVTIDKASNYRAGNARAMAPVPLDASRTLLVQLVDEDAQALVYQTNVRAAMHVPHVTSTHRHTLYVTDHATGRTRRIEVVEA